MLDSACADALQLSFSFHIGKCSLAINLFTLVKSHGWKRCDTKELTQRVEDGFTMKLWGPGACPRGKPVVAQERASFVFLSGLSFRFNFLAYAGRPLTSVRGVSAN